MFGIGKPRSKFGRWLDKNNIKQIELMKKSGLGHGTISRICNEKDCTPKYSTFVKIQRALKNKWNKEVDYEDFWSM